MQKSAWVASLDLLGRSDPRLFVREIEKRSSDLCKRMQVASAAAATHRCDQLWRRVKIAVPGAAVVSRPFSLLPFDVFVPRFPFFPNLFTISLSLSLVSLYSSTSILFSQVTGHGGEEAKRKEPDDVYEWAVLRLCTVQLTAESGPRIRRLLPLSLSFQSRL